MVFSVFSDQFNKFFFKTSYLNKIIKSVNLELGKIQKNSKEFCKIIIFSNFFKKNLQNRPKFSKKIQKSLELQ